MKTEESFAEFSPTYVRAHSESSTRLMYCAGNVAGMGNSGDVHLDAELVVDRAGVGDAVCPGLDFAFLYGAQQIRDVRTSIVVLVGGPENGGHDASGKNGRRSEKSKCRQVSRSLVNGRALSTGSLLFGAHG
jgi:hypothetical protein